MSRASIKCAHGYPCTYKGTVMTPSVASGRGYCLQTARLESRAALRPTLQVTGSGGTVIVLLQPYYSTVRWRSPRHMPLPLGAFLFYLQVRPLAFLLSRRILTWMLFFLSFFLSFFSLLSNSLVVYQRYRLCFLLFFTTNDSQVSPFAFLFLSVLVTGRSFLVVLT